VKRRDFLVLIGSAAGVALPLFGRVARTQTLPPIPGQPNQPVPLSQATQTQASQIGQVATLEGSATVTRASAAPIALKISDYIFAHDVLTTGENSTLGVTFEDETTFNLSANSTIAVDAYVYEDGGAGNSALISVSRGTAAFVASLVARTGDMRIATPTTTLGIRGTTGIVEVGEGGAEPQIKLYADEDGHVGQIEVFDPRGARLGTLTQASTAFAIRTGPGGRLLAVSFAVPPREAARDRFVLQRLVASHRVGRAQTGLRRQLRGRGPNQFRQPGNFRRPNTFRQPGNFGRPFNAPGQPPRPGPQFRGPRGNPPKPRPNPKDKR
jgi:hypothetical protein